VPGFLAGAIMVAGALALPQGFQPILKLSVILFLYLGTLALLSKDRLVSAGRTLQECIR